MLASNPSQQVESDSRSFENPLDSVKTDRALKLDTITAIAGITEQDGGRSNRGRFRHKAVSR